MLCKEWLLMYNSKLVDIIPKRNQSTSGSVTVLEGYLAVWFKWLLM